jgi:hypothetical protein
MFRVSPRHFQLVILMLHASSRAVCRFTLHASRSAPRAVSCHRLRRRCHRRRRNRPPLRAVAQEPLSPRHFVLGERACPPTAQLRRPLRRPPRRRCHHRCPHAVHRVCGAQPRRGGTRLPAGFGSPRLLASSWTATLATLFRGWREVGPPTLPCGAVVSIRVKLCGCTKQVGREARSPLKGDSRQWPPSSHPSPAWWMSGPAQRLPRACPRTWTLR